MGWPQSTPLGAMVAANAVDLAVAAASLILAFAKKETRAVVLRSAARQGGGDIAKTCVSMCAGSHGHNASRKYVRGGRRIGLHLPIQLAAGDHRRLVAFSSASSSRQPLSSSVGNVDNGVGSDDLPQASFIKAANVFIPDRGLVSVFTLPAVLQRQRRPPPLRLRACPRPRRYSSATSSLSSSSSSSSSSTF